MLVIRAFTCFQINGELIQRIPLHDCIKDVSASRTPGLYSTDFMSFFDILPQYSTVRQLVKYRRLFIYHFYLHNRFSAQPHQAFIVRFDFKGKDLGNDYVIQQARNSDFSSGMFQSKKPVTARLE